MADHICVIGGTGFIGASVVELLSGRRVTVIGRNVEPTRKLPDGVEYRAGDYGDSYFLRGVLDRGGIGEIICLAHTTVPKTSFDDPVRDLFDNLPAAIRLFQIAATLPIRRLVFVSSGGTTYGPTDRLPISEDAPTQPISPYGISKLAIENYAFMYRATHALPIICVRPANAYGPGQIPYTGQGFVATTMASLLAGKELVLFGEQGTIRDFIHVRDVAAGIVAALDRGIVGAHYNIGCGEGSSTREVLDRIVSLAGPDGYRPKVNVLPSRRFDVPANVLDATRLQRDTGWKPTIAFDQGLQETWSWYRDAYRPSP